jgi:hypothetical protein
MNNALQDVHMEELLRLTQKRDEALVKVSEGQQAVRTLTAEKEELTRRCADFEATRVQLAEVTAARTALGAQHASQGATLRSREEELTRLRADHSTTVAQLDLVRGELAALRAEAAPALELVKVLTSEKEALAAERARVESLTDEVAELNRRYLRLEQLGFQIGTVLCPSCSRPPPPDASPKAFYDAIIDIRDVRDACGSGWAVCFNDKEKILGDLNGLAPKVVISVVGNFNAGKSFLVGKLGRADVISGDQVATNGISIKVADLQKGAQSTKLCFLDTQGLNSPAKPWKHSPGACLADRLQAAKALEEFVKQSVLSASDVFIFVVPQMSAKDQLDVYLLYQAALACRKARPNANVRIIVVHNLRGWTHHQLLRHRYAQSIMEMLNGSDCQLEMNVVEGTGEDWTLAYLLGFMGPGGEENASLRVPVEHYFLTRETAEGCQNEKTIEQLQTAFLSIQASDVNVMARLRTMFTKWLPLFVDTVPAKVSFVIEEGRAETNDAAEKLLEAGDEALWFSAVPGDGAAPPAATVEPCRTASTHSDVQARRDQTARSKGVTVSIRPHPLPAIFRLPSDGVKFNFVDRQLKKRVTARREVDVVCRSLCIELSGADPTSIVMMRPAGGHQPETKNWVRVWSEGGLHHVEVHMTVESLPEGILKPGVERLAWTEHRPHFEGVYKSLPAELEARNCRFTTDDDHYVFSEGTRCVPRGSVDSVLNFTMDFSPSDLPWDVSIAPCATFADGVLAITFVLGTMYVANPAGRVPRSRHQDPATDAIGPDLTEQRDCDEPRKAGS